MRSMGVINETVAAEFCNSTDTPRMANLIHQRGSLGILVLAPPVRLQQMNQRAWHLITQINHSDGGNGNGNSKTAKGLLPAVLLQICVETFKHLHSRTATKDWEQFEVKKIIGAPHHPILVRGFGAPDSRGSQHSRIVIILEEIGRRKEESKELREIGSLEEGSSQQTYDHITLSGQKRSLRDRLMERFQFTEREQEVIQCLMKGWINKEIASELGIALPTVKEHIRHIMDKTKTTTRTGVLMRIFR